MTNPKSQHVQFILQSIVDSSCHLQALMLDGDIEMQQAEMLAETYYRTARHHLDELKTIFQKSIKE